MDHFDGIHALPEEAAILEGAPNFRQVTRGFLGGAWGMLHPLQVMGFPVFGCAQPTEEGLRLIALVSKGRNYSYLPGKFWRRWNVVVRQTL